jgi:hypothetical protein
MDIKALDKALQEIVKTRAELSTLDYNNPKYDDLEERLHDLEDDFQDDYGDYMEEVLKKIHDEHCPESDVLLPIAYIGAGVPVDMKKAPGHDIQLVLEANPPRLSFRIKDAMQVVWIGK